MKTQPIRIFFDNKRKLKYLFEIIRQCFIDYDEALNETEFIDIDSDFDPCLTATKKEDSITIKFNGCFRGIGKGTIGEYSYKLYKNGKVELNDAETFHCLGPSTGLCHYLLEYFNVNQTEMVFLYNYLNKKIKKIYRKMEKDNF